jgi:DNA-binding winged helix-turn-helix (wHTH) protein
VSNPPADTSAAGGRAETAPRAYEFGPYPLEPRLHRLLRNSDPVPLTPKAFDTLLALIERRDRVVEKAELMRLVWPDSFLEEANLSQTIFVLRKTLGDGPDGRPFIDTVPRRGYCFAAEVRAERVKPAPPGRPPQPRRVYRVAAVAAAVLVVAALGWFQFSSGRMVSGTPAAIESLVVLPFESLSAGTEQNYLADSMMDALITNLGQIGGLRVQRSAGRVT